MPHHPMLTNILALADPAAWQASLDLAEEALAGWPRRSFRRIVFTGHGSSLFNGLVARSVVEHIAGLPCEAVAGFHFARYAEPALLGRDVLVAGISTTGTTESVCAALEAARAAGSPILAITARPGTPITRGADLTLLTGGADDEISVKTKSYVQALVAPYLLALHLAGENAPRDYWLAQIRRAGEAAGEFLQKQRGGIEALAEAFAPQAPKVFVLGTGPNLGTAEEASLKMIEMAKMYSECQELEDFFHGRLREVDAHSPLVFIAPSGRASRRVLDFLTVTDRVGTPSVVLTDEITPGIRRLATHVIQLPGGLDEFATPLLYIIPMHLFGYEMAVRRGYDPNARRYDIVPQTVKYEGDDEKT